MFSLKLDSFHSDFLFYLKIFLTFQSEIAAVDTKISYGNLETQFL